MGSWYVRNAVRLFLLFFILYSGLTFFVKLNQLISDKRFVRQVPSSSVVEGNQHVSSLARLSKIAAATEAVGTGELSREPATTALPTARDESERGVADVPVPKPLLPDGRVFVVVLILSESPDMPRRVAVRDSWARPIGVYNIDHGLLAEKVNKRGDGHFEVANIYRHFFVVGRLASTLDFVRQEMEKEKDVVMVDENDYASTSVKLYWAFLWAMSKLQFEYVVKAQDTAFVNVPSMISWLCLQPPTRFYGGHIVHLARIIKRKRSPWYMAEEFYRGKFYPDYLLSFAFVLSQDMVRLITDVWRDFLDRNSKGLLHVDDLDVGLTMRKYSVPAMHVQRFYKGFAIGLCRDKLMVVIADVPQDKLQTLGDNMKRTGYPSC